MAEYSDSSLERGGGGGGWLLWGKSGGWMDR